MGRSNGGFRAYAELSARQRAKALDAYDELVESAAHALSAGFHSGELHETLGVSVRRHRVYVWPALVRRILRDGRREALPEWGH